MPELLTYAAVALVVTMVLGLIPLLRAEGSADRMLAVQLLGTNGVALLLLLAWVLERPALLDVGLVLALLAAVAVIAFTRSGDGDDRA